MFYTVFLFSVRLDSIAIDAELQEKSEADLKQLAEVLQKRVEESMAEYAQKLQDDPTFDGGSNMCVYILKGKWNKTSLLRLDFCGWMSHAMQCMSAVLLNYL